MTSSNGQHTHHKPEKQKRKKMRQTGSPWNVGLVGLGKLGMPVALAMSLKGHDVMGYDVAPERMQ